MKNNKLFIGLCSLALIALTGCGTTEASASVSTEPSVSVSTSVSTSTSVPEAYPALSIRIKGVEEVEAGCTATIRALVTLDVQDDGVSENVNFTVADPTVIALPEDAEDVISVVVTGLKAGTTTITATSVANPNVSKNYTITVLEAKPTLKNLWNNIIDMDNYTIEGGTFNGIDEADYEESMSPTNYVRVTDNAIVTTDSSNGVIYADSTTKNAMYGIALSNAEDQRAVYLEAPVTGGTYGAVITEDAPLAKGDSGFLTKDTFMGLKTNASSPNDVSAFYSLAAFNPKWFVADKEDDNTYLIEGKDDEETEDNTSTNVGLYSSFVETLLWQLTDPEGYLRFSSSAESLAFTAFASEIETTIVVTSASDFLVQILTSDGTYHYAKITDVGTTSMDDIPAVATALSTGLTPAEATLSSDLTAAKTLLSQNDYIQTNYAQPNDINADQFKAFYNIYHTEDYIFYYYDADFITEYNRLAGEDETLYWNEPSYGYRKQADGIYKFTYTEPATAGANGTITLADTKEEGTTAETTMADWANYISTSGLATGDLLYTLTDTQSTIWEGVSTKYHRTSSRMTMLDIAAYYGIVPSSEAYDKVLAGVGTSYDENDSMVINFTYGYHIPTDSDNWYQAYHFYLSGFGTCETTENNPLNVLD
ncbi:MAG: hypothetical protein WCR67_04855 [Bacilli bacterium]